MTEIKDALPEKPKKDNMAELYETVEPFIYVLVIMVTIFCFLIRPATVVGSSMVPTLHEGDQLALQQIAYSEPQYGDIVVVDRTLTGEETIVKRVIGKEGDVIYIDFEKHEVWRNDTLLDEPYINEPTTAQYDVQFPVVVPAGTVFVLGDNRNYSGDSRSSGIGMIDLRRIMGKAIFRFWPVTAAGGL